MRRGQDFIDHWRDAIARRDHEALRPLFAENCQFHSPAVWKPKHGGALTFGLVCAFESIVEDFEYRATWVDGTGGEILLEFTALIDGKSLVGLDKVSLNEDGLITRFEVMIRPLNALIEVATRMAAHVERLEAAA